MGLRASDPAGHHGWGGRWMRCGRRPGFRGDSPISGPTGAGPVSGGVHSTGAAVSPPTGEVGLNLRRNALSGLQNGRRGPSRSFSGEGGDRDCRKPGEIADLTLSSGRGPGRVSPQVSITSWKCAKIRLSSRDVESGQLLGSEAQPGRNNPYWNQHPGTVAHQPSGRTPTVEGLHREDGDQVSYGSEDQHVGHKRENRDRKGLRMAGEFPDGSPRMGLPLQGAQRHEESLPAGGGENRQGQQEGRMARWDQRGHPPLGTPAEPG